jgi:hypothetical protein
MTIFAGILARGNGAQITEAVCESIRHAISRFRDESIWEFRDDRAFLAKIDIGAYGEPGFLLGKKGSVSLLAGEPLLKENNGHTYSTRLQDLDRLQQNWDSGKWDITSSTRGIFCAAHYEPAKKRISLVVDKLGIRPIYFWVGEEYFVFATALRVLEVFPEAAKIMDLRAVAELAAFGYPLANRTPYSGISVLRAAEIFQCDDNSTKSWQYWRWDQMQRLDLSYEDLLGEAYRRFVQAVERRLRTDKTTVAFLSGGLDSRCVVSVLRSKEVTVNSFNFGIPRTQDQVLGTKFANKVGTIHTNVPFGPEGDVSGYAKTLSRALISPKYLNIHPADRLSLAWSGEGGSVGVGSVYLDAQIVDLLRTGKVESAIDLYLDQQEIGLPSKLFSSSIAQKLVLIPKQGIVEELEEIHCEDRGRAFHLFLMFNDQRRHLSHHFEGIDLHRIELQVPFFDGDFLDLVLRAPIDIFLRHRFYHAWLSRFPSSVTTVPWQTYPGHAKCPLPVPGNLVYQWGKEHGRTGQKRRLRSLTHQTFGLLRAKDFPHEIVRKVPLAGATLLTGTGLKNYGYILRTASIFYDYWKRCNGRYRRCNNEL